MPTASVTVTAERAGPARRWIPRLLAAVTGAGLALAFPAVNAWWWAWSGLVPFLLLVAGAGTFREAGWRSWWASAGFFGTLHHWVLPFLGVFWPLALLVLGLVWVPFGLVAYGLLRRLTPLRTAAALLVLPSVWVAVEALRSWRHLGGTWGLLGSSQWQARPVLGLAALGGVWLISFALVAVNSGLAIAVLPKAGRRVRLAGGGAAVALAALAVCSGLVRPEPVVTGVMRVAGVQPGPVPGPERRVATHLRLTGEIAGRDPDVVVWGQSSVALDPARRPDVDRLLRRAAAETGADLLVNVDAADSSGRISKSARQYTPDGVVDVYVKRRLVPFGEYVPLRPVLGWIAGHTEAAEEDRVAGAGPAVFDVAGRRVGPLISYESTFPDLRRDLARRGVDLTITQGSLTTFHGSWAHAQQASFEALRAVESGRPAVLVEMDGTSSVFDARGGRLAWFPPEFRGAFVVDVPLSAEETPYLRLGDWVPALAGGIALGAGAVAAARRLTGRSRGQVPR
ncbi:apolipoprotein N-acyltransferase [Nonomuraea cavernae]|uniref:Apolipoprotein N-acyltransferase n=1 Tax=Nonomuraea cavernae TaxID=2045107 RepID=A0A917Z3J5_9ACTN|nr:apolipoprotein N-acyltransferase [Nonomuraea cavernae]MCA2188150.1 apolipoprotein N-acyltransferase [Nonomuraea cavernae]GGO72941.1 apolipoprotein N-acyltransferase [Nonomuraea cavernae]